MAVVQRLADAVKPRVGATTRKRITRTRFALRRPTAPLRALPDFLVIGAMRGGTSSLYKYLAQHPEVSASLRKEVEYFTRHFDRSELWYRSHFGLAFRRRLARSRGRGLQFFEASPYYLFEPRCPARVHDRLPGVRLIALLRDPVDRAFSDYQHMVRLGFEKLSFEEALAAEPERTASEVARMWEDPDYFSKDHHHFSYFERGRYAPQLERWLEHFPREQLLVLESADLYQDPVGLLHGIEDFLGLTRWVPDRFRNYSYVGEPPERSSIDPALRKLLREGYAADDAALAELLGRTPSWCSV